MSDGIGRIDETGSDQISQQHEERDENIQQGRAELYAEHDALGVGEQKEGTGEDLVKQTEIIEQATLRPEESIELDRDIQESEDLQQAFNDMVEVSSQEESTDSAWDDPGDISGVGDDQTAEVKSILDQNVNDAGQDQLESAETVTPLAEINFDGTGTDIPGMVIVGPGGENENQLDLGQDTYEQSGDIREPIREGGSPGDVLNDANRTEAAGQMGDVIPEGIDLPGGAGVPDLLDGPGGIDPSGLGGPDIGTDQMGEVLGLKDSVGSGADPRISSDSDSGSETENESGTGSSSGVDLSFPEVSTSQPLAGPVPISMNPGSSASGGSGGSTGGENSEGPVTDKKKSNITSGDETGSQGGTASGRFMGDQNRGSSSSQKITDKLVNLWLSRESTPDPEGGEGSFDDTLDGVLPGAVPDVSPLDETDLKGSLSQPVDDESGHRPPPQIEYDQSSQVDPYAQYTGDETGGFGEIPVGEQDVDGNLIDGPGTAGGGVLNQDEGLMLNTEDDKNRDAADPDDAQNMAASDGKI